MLQAQYHQQSGRALCKEGEVGDSFWTGKQLCSKVDTAKAVSDDGDEDSVREDTYVHQYSGTSDSLETHFQECRRLTSFLR
jgi:hypothetical protein